MGIVNTLDKYMFHGISPQKGGKTKLAFRNPYPPPITSSRNDVKKHIHQMLFPKFKLPSPPGNATR